MTIKDVRDFTRLVCEWCVEQDDLRGFDVWVVGPPDWPAVRVALYWPNAWVAARDYVMGYVQILETDRECLNATLDSLAVEARKRAARIADPNRLPG